MPYLVRRCQRLTPDVHSDDLSYRQSVSHSELFDADASAVWRVLIDWAAIVDWMPHGIISRLDIEGTGVGAVRHMVTRDGVRIAERLDYADEQRGRLDLSILEPLPWDMLSYRARAQLDELGPGQCRLQWEGRFELPDDGRAAEGLVTLLGKSYKLMFAGLRQQLSAS